MHATMDARRLAKSGGDQTESQRRPVAFVVLACTFLIAFAAFAEPRPAQVSIRVRCRASALAD